MNDPYRVLNVPRDADPAAIKAAYRRLAKECHPDRNPGDARAEQRFKDLSRAYGILSDPMKRVQFDRGEIDGDGNVRQGFGFSGFGFGRGAGAGGGADTSGFESFFERAFGNNNASRRTGGFAGADAQAAFEEILRGHGRRAGQRQSGAKGRNTRHHLEVDFITAVRGGRQRVRLSGGRSLEVEIPPGSSDGQTLRLKGQGRESALGGEAGDALIEIAVRPHPRFTRDGADIHLEVPVSLSEAVLGARIEVETVDGPVMVAVPPGSSSGRRLRLKGRGVAKAAGGRGDQYVRLMIVLPEQVGPDLERWARKHAYDVRTRSDAA